MAVYHLAKGARPLNIGEFLDPALLPTDCQVAAVVGDTLDPENGLETNGIRSYTMWGEIGAQLGREAWKVLADSDAQRTAPGKVTLQEAVGTRPTVIIIDEIAQSLRQLASSGNPDTRRRGTAGVSQEPLGARIRQPKRGRNHHPCDSCRRLRQGDQRARGPAQPARRDFRHHSCRR